MELYAKGQLSFLILNCLLERDFYGLDIITEIKARTSGNVDLKKPSVYSNLTRMEKQGQVSSYMRASELGPNRRYYSITEKGRETYEELKDEFERNHIDVFKDFRGDNEPIELVKPERIVPQVAHSFENQQSDINDDEIEQEDMSDFFDFSSLNEQNSPASKEETKEENFQQLMQEQFENALFPNKNNELQENKIQEESLSQVEEKIEGENLATSSPVFMEDNSISEAVQSVQASTTQPVQEKFEDKVENKTIEKNDAVFLSKDDANEYNKRIYDISKDINRYRRRRSFAEDQIAISVEAPLRDSEERTKQKVEEFKNSLIENKTKYNNRMTSEEFFSMINKEEKEEEKAPVKTHEDDGVFITSRMSDTSVMKARKIEPPRLKIDATPGKDKLPAPKRDITIDPSHKEIISRIYAKSRTGQEDEEVSNVLYDYNDLKGYYRNQNIKFSAYQKENSKVCHNTNKLNFITSLIVFAVFAGLSAIAFAVLNSVGFISSQTNFLFILFPALYLADVAFQGYNYLRHTSWEPNPIMKQLYVWGLALILAGVVVGVNFGCGLNTENFAEFATSIIIPIVAIIMVLPFRYYVKRAMLIKYWR